MHNLSYTDVKVLIIKILNLGLKSIKGNLNTVLIFYQSITIVTIFFFNSKVLQVVYDGIRLISFKIRHTSFILNSTFSNNNKM